MNDVLQWLSDFMLTQALLWIFYAVIIILAAYGIFSIVKAVFLHYEKTSSDLATEGLEFASEKEKKTEKKAKKKG